MLLHLRISHYALLENIEVDFDPGLNILTGETGSGKSLLMDAVQFCLGERGSVERIRLGEKSFKVSLVFSLNSSLRHFCEEAGLHVDEQEILITRELQNEGRSKAYLNQQPLSIQFLKKLGQRLMNFQDQNQKLFLTDPVAPYELLDSFAGIKKKKDSFQQDYYRCKEIDGLLMNLEEKERKNTEELEFIEFRLDDLQSAGLVAEEDEQIKERIKEISYQDKINRDIKKIRNLFNTPGGDVLQPLWDIHSFVAKVSKHKLAWGEMAEKIHIALEDLDDMRRQIQSIPLDMESEKELDGLNSRLHYLEGFKRKYHRTLAELIIYQNELEVKKNETMDLPFQKRKLHLDRKNLQKEMGKKALLLSRLRQSKASLLADQTTKSLQKLGMEGAEFKVLFETNLPDVYTDQGMEKIVFALKSNTGEPMLPLAKIASGGEMSRVMLVLKVIFGDLVLGRTLVLDEIDSGIGGRVGTALGKEIKAMSRSHQVICITHLRQIAAFADRHLLVSKITHSGRTFSSVEKLTKKEINLELSRMVDEIPSGVNL